MEKIIIDATGKRVGRIASRAAALLMGKGKPSYERHILPHVAVEITHASRILTTGKKMSSTHHKRYSGFHGGLKTETLNQIAAQKGFREIIRHAIRGMVRRNKLHKQIMKNLTIVE